MTVNYAKTVTTNTNQMEKDSASLIAQYKIVQIVLQMIRINVNSAYQIMIQAQLKFVLVNVKFKIVKLVSQVILQSVKFAIQIIKLIQVSNVSQFVKYKIAQNVNLITLIFVKIVLTIMFLIKIINIVYAKFKIVKHVKQMMENYVKNVTANTNQMEKESVFLIAQYKIVQLVLQMIKINVSNAYPTMI
ncbi:transmembrane protein, putative (macronuclear) [Tetrahymena thermophila SB210]|uniref:Transmembrane protein, putative n=1 Tax=Tetrahymena thermophila (strain SB210) TaxID=312017 RepID=W7XCY2_TETTS|nr:transmembrane protein, putative [Tetrahymena thermophila SB210]EWS75317.1 transmembrane protein, putative [Tetrahymena thermophila SB210]|eukprot:XP_012652149.1 transmembrane protein, putative [Tetrahymena thermophila SB210]